MKNYLCNICRESYLINLEEINLQRIFICKNCLSIVNESFSENIEMQSDFQKNNSWCDDCSEETVFKSVESTLNLLKWLFEIAPPQDRNNFLDYGTGRGYISFAARILGFKNVYAKDFHENLFNSYKEKCIKKYDCVKDIKFITDINNNTKFDFITLWHVLEHIQDPVNFLYSLHSLMDERSILAIQTPQYQKKYVEKYHKIFFNEQSILYISKKTKFEIVEINFDPTNSFMTTVMRKK